MDKSMGEVYYNENDPYCAEWLRNLIKAGQLPPGRIDERSIEDVVPNELVGYRQCHFFAGIGIWPLAFQRSNWPSNRRVWSGSCPCQPFSSAGEGAGFADERHLWPAFFHLIRVNEVETVFGEQVASKGGLGWLDLVQADLEGEGYSLGATSLCAAGFGAIHVRKRLWWVANSVRQGRTRLVTSEDLSPTRQRRWYSQSDMQQIVESPFVAGDSWPPPLLRKMDDADTTRVGRLRAYGNAIDLETAIEFINSYLETENGQGDVCQPE